MCSEPRHFDDRGHTGESQPAIASERQDRRPREKCRDEECDGIAGNSDSSRSDTEQSVEDRQSREDVSAREMMISIELTAPGLYRSHVVSLERTHLV
jgi:hypothetical protein